MKRRTSLAAGALALTAVASTAHAVEAAAGPARSTHVGRDAVPSYSCATPTGKGLFVQWHSSEDRYEVPTEVVITSYRVTAGLKELVSVGFRLLRVGAGGVEVVAASPQWAVPAASSVTRPVRLPVRGGEVLGLYVESTGPGTAPCLSPTQYAGDTVLHATADLQPGESFPGGVYAVGGVLSVSAELEPDGDRDGYGDVTQDDCATDPTTQADCAASAPETTIRSARTARNGRTTLVLTASEAATYRCAVDSATFRACTSTFRVRLRPGRHEIAVVATDAHGNTDPTPAVRRLRVRG